MPLTNPTSLVGADGWSIDTATWTRTANTTFTTVGDTTAQFSKGTRLRVTDTTTKYFVVVGSSHSSGTTTVTITGGDDYVLAANPTDRYYSYAASPQGFPGYFAFTPTYGGFSSAPSGAMRFSILGRTMHCYLTPAAGTSNATSFTLTIPVASVTAGAYQFVRAQNNGSELAPPAMIELATSTTVTVYRDGTGAAWTASNGKRIQGSFLVEI